MQRLTFCDTYNRVYLVLIVYSGKVRLTKARWLIKVLVLFRFGHHGLVVKSSISRTSYHRLVASVKTPSYSRNTTLGGTGSMRSIIIGRQISYKLFSDTKHIEIFGVVFRLIYLQVNRFTKPYRLRKPHTLHVACDHIRRNLTYNDKG